MQHNQKGGVCHACGRGPGRHQQQDRKSRWGSSSSSEPTEPDIGDDDVVPREALERTERELERVRELLRQSQLEIQRLYEEHGRPDSSAARPDWVRGFDERYQLHYFFNMRTSERYVQVLPYVVRYILLRY